MVSVTRIRGLVQGAEADAMSKPLLRKLGDCYFCQLPVMYGTPAAANFCQCGSGHAEVAHQCCEEAAQGLLEKLEREEGLIPERRPVVVM